MHSSDGGRRPFSPHSPPRPYQAVSAFHVLLGTGSAVEWPDMRSLLEASVCNAGEVGVMSIPNSQGCCETKHSINASSHRDTPVYHVSGRGCECPLCVGRLAWCWERSDKQDGPGPSPHEAQGIADFSKMMTDGLRIRKQKGATGPHGRETRMSFSEKPCPRSPRTEALGAKSRGRRMMCPRLRWPTPWCPWNHNPPGKHSAPLTEFENLLSPASPFSRNESIKETRNFIQMSPPQRSPP